MAGGTETALLSIDYGGVCCVSPCSWRYFRHGATASAALSDTPMIMACLLQMLTIRAKQDRRLQKQACFAGGARRRVSLCEPRARCCSVRFNVVRLRLPVFAFAFAFARRAIAAAAASGAGGVEVALHPLPMAVAPWLGRCRELVMGSGWVVDACSVMECSRRGAHNSPQYVFRQGRCKGGSAVQIASTWSARNAGRAQ